MNTHYHMFISTKEYQTASFENNFQQCINHNLRHCNVGLERLRAMKNAQAVATDVHKKKKN